MNFSNPYPHTNHEVYQHTFLQTIAAEVRFTSVYTPDEYWQKFKKFGKEVFNLSITETPLDKDQYAELSSEKTETTYSFKNDAASVVLGPKGYKSFGDSMPVHFLAIKTFLKDVVPSAKIYTLSIEKKNRFPFHITLKNFDIKEALNYVFKTEHVKDMEYQIENGQLVKVTKEAKVDLGNHANILLTIGFQVIDDASVNVLFDLKSSYSPPEGINMKILYNLAAELNDIMYDAFKYVVSENIINVLKKCNGQ